MLFPNLTVKIYNDIQYISGDIIPSLVVTQNAKKVIYCFIVLFNEYSYSS